MTGKVLKGRGFDTRYKERRYVERGLRMQPWERIAYLLQLKTMLMAIHQQSAKPIKKLSRSNMNLEQSYQEFMGLLQFHQAEYMIIGGFAAAAHGYIRATGDIDLWVNSSPENAVKMTRVMHDFGYTPEEISEEDFTLVPNVIMFGDAEINLLTLPDGLSDFKHSYQSAMHVHTQGMHLCFISLEDLIKNKEAVGREKDLVDVRQLRQIQEAIKGSK